MILRYDASLIKRKKIVKISILSIIFVFFLFFGIPLIANAGIKHWFATIYATLLSLFDNGLVTSNVLTYTDWLNDEHGFANLISVIASTLKTVCGIFILVYTLIEVIRLAVNETLTFEKGLQIFVKFAVTTMVILNADTIFKGINGLFVYIINGKDGESGIKEVITREVSGLSSNNFDELVASIEEDLGDPNPLVALWNEIKSAFTFFVNYIHLFVTYIVGYIIKWFIIVGAQFAIVKNILEIWIRQAFAPVGLLNLMESGIGNQNAGIRYIKKVIACYIHIIIYCLAMPLTEYLTHNLLLDINIVEMTLADGLMFVLKNVAFTGIVIGFCKGASNLADDVIGVR